MNDTFTDTFWEIVKESPDLQQAIFKNMGSTEDKYSIPRGDITVSVFSKDEKTRQPLVDAIKKVHLLTVKDLAKMLAEVKIDITLKEVQGEQLQPYDATLRDLDLTALAVVILVKWLKAKGHIKEVS